MCQTTTHLHYTPRLRLLATRRHPRGKRPLVIPPVDVKEGTAILEKLFNEFPQLPSPECPIGQDSNTRFTDRKELSPRTFLHIAWPIAVDRPSVSKEKSFWSSTTKHIATSLHSLLQDVRKGHAVFVTLDLQSGYSG